MRKELLSLLGLVAAAMAPCPVAAVTYSFDLTGSLASQTEQVFSDPDYVTRLFAIDLGSVAAVDLAVGDTIAIRFRLDQPLSLPATTAFTYLGVSANLSTDLVFDPTGDEAGSSQITYVGGTFDGQAGPSIGCPNCLAAQDFFAPGPDFMFSGFDGVINVERLDAADPAYAGPVRLTGFSFNYQLTDAVPEPTSWALMIVGFGLIGMIKRARPSSIASLTA